MIPELRHETRNGNIPEVGGTRSTAAGTWTLRKDGKNTMAIPYSPTNQNSMTKPLKTPYSSNLVTIFRVIDFHLVEIWWQKCVTLAISTQIIWNTFHVPKTSFQSCLERVPSPIGTYWRGIPLRSIFFSKRCSTSQVRIPCSQCSESIITQTIRGNHAEKFNYIVTKLSTRTTCRLHIIDWWTIVIKLHSRYEKMFYLYCDEDILHYYLLAKTQQRWARGPVVVGRWPFEPLNDTILLSLGGRSHLKRENHPSPIGLVF
jgi:hypothetical protein